jgi:HNH endonuclease
MLWTAQPCGCTSTPVMGVKRPRFCEHGHLFVSERASATSPVAEESKPRLRRFPLKRGRGFAASSAQQAKVKDAPCVVCGLDRHEAQIHAAHVYPRRFQSCDCPEGVVPLCSEHHRLYDDPYQHLDLMPALVEREYQAELVHAVAVHHVPLGHLIEVVTGVEWKPVGAVAA